MWLFPMRGSQCRYRMSPQGEYDMVLGTLSCKKPYHAIIVVSYDVTVTERVLKVSRNSPKMLHQRVANVPPNCGTFIQTHIITILHCCAIWLFVVRLYKYTFYCMLRHMIQTSSVQLLHFHIGACMAGYLSPSMSICLPCVLINYNTC